MFKFDRESEAFRTLERFVTDPATYSVAMAVQEPEFCTVCNRTHPKKVSLKRNEGGGWTPPLSVFGTDHISGPIAPTNATQPVETTLLTVAVTDDDPYRIKVRANPQFYGDIGQDAVLDPTPSWPSPSESKAAVMEAVGHVYDAMHYHDTGEVIDNA